MSQGAYAASHLAMAVLHADRDHDAAQARDAAVAFKLDSSFKECGHPESRWPRCPPECKIRHRNAAR